MSNKFPSYFEFYNPVKIICGAAALENIPHELNLLGARKPLLITSPAPIRTGLMKACLLPLKTVIFDTVPRDSSFQTVSDLALLYRQKNCDSLIALGGGSVLDTAKGLRILLSQNADNLEPFMGNEKISPGVHVPFVMIPTTSGTGSECTKVAVIADTRTSIKHEFISERILPDVAVIDPRSTLTLPPYLTAATGVDALVHAIEAYTCLQHNPLSDVYAKTAVELIGEYIVKAVSEGANPEYRTAMSAAALMAGIAFSNSMVGLVHAIGHACGAVSKVAHGDAMGILLPSVMRFNMDVMQERYGELFSAFAGAEYFAQVQSRERANKLVDEIENLLGYLHQKCGLPLTLSQAGVLREDFEQIAKLAINDGAIILNPKPAGIPEITSILENALR